MIHRDYSRADGEWVPNYYGGNENLEAIAFLRYTNQTIGRAAGRGDVGGGVHRLPRRHPAAGRQRSGVPLQMEPRLDARHAQLHEVRSVHRKYHHNQMTFGMLYAYTENFVLPISHDEVVHGKNRSSTVCRATPAEIRQPARLLRLYVGASGQEAAVYGCEFAQGREWNFDTSLDWHLLKGWIIGITACSDWYAI